MNILFLPENIASIPALTAAELNKIEGVKAISITQSLSKYQTVNEAVKFLPTRVTKRKPLKWLYHAMTNTQKIRELIEWADILHYTWSPYFKDARDLKWARELGKVIFIEWAGSDIRNPEVLFPINPYYKQVFNHGYEYSNDESAANSQKGQAQFATYGAIPFQSPEMNLYIDKTLFSHTFSLLQRLNIKDFNPQYPKVDNKKVLIVHSPSAKIAKGSTLIIPVIEELKRDYDIDFRLLHNMSRSEVLTIMQEADIFIDQLIVGGYGLAATEAMAMGKPVMCYIMPEVFKEGLSMECPIYNTNPDNLKANLINLVTDAQLRYELGVKGRQFAEKYHDLSIIASQLVQTYKSALKRD